MVTPSPKPEDAWRPATVSPFGLLADLGAAVAAELGMSPRQIAGHLAVGSGHLVGDEVARAAVVRGRRELVARRVNPARFRSASVPGRRSLDTVEQLLAWGEGAAGYAGTAALRARAYLRELAALHQAAQQQPVPQPTLGRRERTQRGAQTGYRSLVLAWAASQHLPIPANGKVPKALIEAYETAHAEAPATDPPQPPAPSPEELRAAKDAADRAAIERVKAATIAGLRSERADAAPSPPGAPPASRELTRAEELGSSRTGRRGPYRTRTPTKRALSAGHPSSGAA